MSAALRRYERMSLDEFRDWDPGDANRYELVDGFPRALAPASNVHATLLGEIEGRIWLHLRTMRPDCTVLTTPGLVPGVLARNNYRIPDFAVQRTPVRPGETGLVQPILVIEILSSGNLADTWSNVWSFTTVPSLQEIVVIDSRHIEAHVLRREGGAWPREPEQVAAGDLALTSIDLRLPLADLYARTGVAR